VGEKRTELSGLVGGTEKRDRRRRNQLKHIILKEEREREKLRFLRQQTPTLEEKTIQKEKI